MEHITCSLYQGSAFLLTGLPGSHREDAPPLPTHEDWRKPGNWATAEQRGPLWPENVPVHRIEASPLRNPAAACDLSVE